MGTEFCFFFTLVRMISQAIRFYDANDKNMGHSPTQHHQIDNTAIWGKGHTRKYIFLTQKTYIFYIIKEFTALGSTRIFPEFVF